MKNSKKIVSSEILYKVINNITYKLCNRCENYKQMNLDNFYKNKLNNQDGYYPYCKPCARAKSTQWANENPEKVKEYDKKKIESNDPIRRIRSKIAAERNRKEGYQKGWRNDNPDKVKANIKKYSNKKHDISLKEWDACRLYFNYRCAYCDLTYEEHYYRNKQDLHKEHAYHNGANNLSNCIPSCRSCNTSKHDLDLELWYNKSNVNYDESRKIRIINWLTDDYKNIKNKKGSVKNES